MKAKSEEAVKLRNSAKAGSKQVEGFTYLVKEGGWLLFTAKSRKKVRILLPA